MSLVFYYSPMSTATLTELVLEELGVPCEKRKLDLRAGETHTPEYLAINPNGKVPCIVHDGTAIWESSAITAYLGEQFGVERGLYPAPGPRRGEAMMWVAWTNVSLGEAVYRYSRNIGDWFPAEQRNAAAGEQAKQDLAKLFGVLDKWLATREYLVGSFTIADTHVASLIDWTRMLGIALAPFANINAWAERCRARPAYQRVMGAAQT